MTQYRPVFWHQGLFLQPQHFQLADLQQQERLLPFQRYLHPHFWGVARMALQGSALPNGNCEVQSGEFLFPDGSFVSVPGNGVLLARSFDPASVTLEKPFTIYAALRKWRANESNVTVVPDLTQLAGVSTRYVSPAQPDDYADAYQEGPAAKVKTLYHVVRLLWESEQDELADHELIPIARVVRDGDSIKPAPDFIPPVLGLEGSAELYKLVRDIRDELTGRALQIEVYKTPVHGESDFDPALMRYKLALRTMARYVPMLLHYSETPSVHPWDLYGLLRSFAAELSTFGMRLNLLGEDAQGARQIPAYDHQRLGPCFERLRRLITELLNEITVAPQFKVDMQFDGVCHTAMIPPRFLDEPNDYYLVFNLRTPIEQHLDSITTAAKLGARNVVESLVERSLPGIGFRYTQVPPPGLPRRSNTYYMRIDTRDSQWPDVERSRELGFTWKDAPEDLRMELVVLRR
ncbi:MAG TPA: type VI secretion system baseplate subunit TssK [Gammaproteobacteria bacterium]|nr:type VI secretion system baseplate subunit TssK [Gammaproteobacteria bacterium]